MYEYKTRQIHKTRKNDGNNDRNQDSNDIESHFLVCSFRTYIADCVNIEAPEVKVDIDEDDKDAIEDGQA